MGVSLGGGNQNPSNFAGLAAANLLTTTSQYKVVAWNPTTTASDLTFQLADTTTVHGFAIGINQTYLSSGAASPINVCLHGISKAIAAASITAGDKLVASGAGLVTPATVTNGSGTGGATTTATFTQIIGWALTGAATSGAELLIYVHPQIIR